MKSLSGYCAIKAHVYDSKLTYSINALVDGRAPEIVFRNAQKYFEDQGRKVAVMEWFDSESDMHAGKDCRYLYETASAAVTVLRFTEIDELEKAMKAAQPKFVILNLERMHGPKPVYWKPYCRGYTNNILLAGVYTADELKAAVVNSDDIVVPIDRLPELLTCDRDVLKSICRDLDNADSFLKSL